MAESAQPRFDLGEHVGRKSPAQIGTQKGVVGTMQTRDELYDYLNYHSYEKKLDELFTRK